MSELIFAITPMGMLDVGRLRFEADVFRRLESLMRNVILSLRQRLRADRSELATKEKRIHHDAASSA
jgi:hypothetical protein